MFNKGLYTDGNPLTQPEGTYRNLLNGSLTDRPGSISFNNGDFEFHELLDHTSAPDANNVVLGSTTLQNGDIVFFVVNTTDGFCFIYRLSGTTTVTTILDDGDLTGGDLDFSENNFISATAKVNYSGEDVVYWTDGLNPPRRLNIDRADEATDIEDINLFSTIDDYPLLDSITMLNGGGALTSGSYSFALSLIDSEGSPTPYFLISQPFPIPREVGVGKGADENEITSNGIRLELSNIDPRYEYVRIAVIKQSDVSILPDIVVEDTITYNYTGAENTTPGSLGEVLINPAFYSSAEVVTQSEGRLYMGNLKRDEQIDFQKYANGIVVKRVEKSVVPTIASVDTGGTTTITDEGFADPDFYIYRTYQRDDVYAFYISLILKNGGETPAYHIPGRDFVGAELDAIPVAEPMRNVADLFPGYNQKFRYWSVEDGTTGMSYWRNSNEVYENEESSDVWEVVGGVGQAEGSTLRDLPVRHHKFPGPDATDPVNKDVDGTVTSLSPNIIGITLENIQIPDDIKEKILGYKVYYAKRTPQNRLVMGQGVTRALDRDTIGGAVSETVFTINKDAPTLGAESIGYVAMKPFSLLNQRTNLGLISYAKEIASPTDDTNAGIGPEFDYYNLASTLGFEVAIAKYIDAGTTVTIPELIDGVDIDHPFWNVVGGDKIFLKLLNDTPPYDYQRRLLNLYRFAIDLYRSRYDQELVWTGYTHTDLNDLDSDEIYGGDTFIAVDEYLVAEPTSATTSADATDQVIVESLDNPSLDHEPTTTEDNVEYNVNYNDEYSDVADKKPAFPSNNLDDFITEFDTRVIRSTAESISAGDEYKRFLENDFLDLPKNTGPIRNLVDNNGILIIHTENALYRTRGREELVTQDFRAYLGSGDIFAVRPQTVFSIDEGYGGLQNHRHAVNTQFGYFFVDTKAGKAFRLADGLDEISKNGMRDWFRNFMNADTSLGYDPELNRVFISSHTTGTIWCLTFLPAENVWESFHSGSPTFYMNNRRDLFSESVGKLYRVGDGNIGSYLGVNVDMEIDYIFNQKPNVDKMVSSLMINMEGDEEDVIPSTVRVRNSHQDTSDIPLVLWNGATGNIRKTKGLLKVNQFRSSSNVETGFPSWVGQKRLSDKYNIVTLKFDYDSSEFVYLYSMDLAVKKAIR